MGANVGDGSQPGDVGSDPVLVEWAAELADRIQAGDPVDLEELTRVHPERAEQLRGLVPAIMMMAGLGASSGRHAVHVGPGSAGPDPAEGLGLLGDYRLLREVGRGGMGVVYEAHQISLSRRVALKILPFASAMDPRRLQRFQIEARAAAGLHHTNIVPIYAVGSERGVPHYAMQFIDGRTLADVIRELRRLEGREPGGAEAVSTLTRSLVAGHFAPAARGGAEDRSGGSPGDAASGLPGRPGAVLPATPPASRRRPTSSSTHSYAFFLTVARLGLQAAEALEHAHRRDVLHRDIKPSNLLIDELGDLWVTDFGLARIAGDSNLSMTGDLLGTLRYMSPEQALGRRVVVDGRTDLYSLGVTLYELLTLRPAFPSDERSELLRQLARVEPPPLQRLNPAVPRDLATIVTKAMAKEPAGRYATAQELADDLRRFLEHKPIRARRPSLSDRAIKWIRRHGPLVATAAALLLLVVAITIVNLSWSNARLRTYIARLEVAIDRADRNEREAERQFELADQRRRFAERHLYAARLRQASEAFRAGQLEHAQDVLDSIRPGSETQEDNLREFAWYYLRHLATREVIKIHATDVILAVADLSPDGRTLAARDKDGRLFLVDLESSQVRADLTGETLHAHDPKFSPDGRSVVAIETKDGTAATEMRLGVLIWDAESGALRARFPMGPERGTVQDARFLGPDSLLICYGQHAQFQRLHLWRWEHPSESPRRIGVFVTETSFSPWTSGDRRGFVTQEGSRLRLRDPDTGAVRVELSGTFHRQAGPWAWSRDGRYVASEVGDRVVVVWDAETGVEKARNQVPLETYQLLFSPDGHQLAVRDDRIGRIHLWEWPAGRARTLQVDEPGRDRRSISMAFHPEGRQLAVSTWGIPGGATPVTLWNIETGKRVDACPGRPDGATRLAFTPDGRSIFFDGTSAILRWRLDQATPIELAGHDDEVWCLAFSPDGSSLFSGGDDTDEPRTLKIWDVATGRLRRHGHPHPATVSALAISPDGRKLATAGLLGDRNLRLWDARTLRGTRQIDLIRTMTGHDDKVRTVAFSPDGTILASGGDDGTIRLWDGSTGQGLRDLQGHDDKVRQVAFSPDGQALASASNDETVRLWDVASGRLRVVLRGQEQFAAVAFAPDGSTLAAVDEGGLIWLWDPATGSLRGRIHSDDGELRCLAWHPDGRSLAVAGAGRIIRLWDPVTGQVLLSLEGHAATVNALAFSPTGRTLASASHDGVIRLWDGQTK